MRVRAVAEVTRVDGRTVTFKLSASDQIDQIGHGTHERVVVNVAKFDARVQKKLGVDQ
jgi:predicted thioesterase